VLLNPNRNPDRVATRSSSTHGVSRRRQVIWLGDGVVDDETGGHIDNLACFAQARRGAAAPGPTNGAIRSTRCRATRSSGWPQRATRAAADRASSSCRCRAAAIFARGNRGVQVREGVRSRLAGMRLAASYVNFYIANGAIIMPLLDPRTDKAAAAGSSARSRPQGGRRAGARDPVRRRQHPLHHPAGTPMTQRTVPRRDIPDGCGAARSRPKLTDSDADRSFGWDKDKAIAATARTSSGSRSCNTRCTRIGASRC
jgi:hypothetical protein